MTEWQKLCSKLNRLIRPQTHPLAIKLLEKEEDFPATIERPRNMGCVVQAINLARRRGLKVGVTSSQFGCGIGLWALGLAKLKEGVDPFRAHMDYVLDMGYYRDKKAATNAIHQSSRIKTRLEPGKYKALLITPLSETPIDPDIILIYGNPAQISRLVTGAIYHHGEVVTSTTHSGLSCASEIIVPFLNNRAQVVIPGTGERVLAMTQDDEMAFALPATQFENLVEGLEIHHKRGIITYPISFRLLERPPPSAGPPAEFRTKLDIIT